MKKLLQELTETAGPSGHEGAVREAILAEVRGLADEVRVDALGNLIVRRRPATTRGAKGSPKGPAQRIMIAAHMDEIGLIVSHVDARGFVHFAPVGTVFGRYLPGSRVRFLNGTPGVVGYDRLEKYHEAAPLEKIIVDVGATGPDDCPVRVGDVAAFDRPFQDFGKRVVAKALDNRAGVAAVIATIRALKSSPHDVYFVFTVQEEITVRGAGASAFGIEPDLAIAVDVTPSGDTPDSLKLQVELGQGAAIKIRDVGMLADGRIVDWMLRTAAKAGIRHQREVLTVGTTDAMAIQVSRSGVLAGALSIPVRYVHSPSEMIDIDDLNATTELLTALLKSPAGLQ